MVVVRSHKPAAVTGAPIFDEVPERMWSEPLRTYNPVIDNDASILERVAVNTPEDFYDNDEELAKYGATRETAKVIPSEKVRSDIRPHLEHLSQLPRQSGAVTYSHVSIVGTRDQNEDAAICLPEQGVFALFDGWGGRSRSHQATLWLQKLAREEGLFSTATDKYQNSRVEMIKTFHYMEGLFNDMEGIKTPAELYAYFGKKYVSRHHIAEEIFAAKRRGCTAVIAKAWPGTGGVTVGVLGDAEAYVLDTDTGTLAVPDYFEAWDTQTNERIEQQQQQQHFAAATIPHGFSDLPQYGVPGQWDTFQGFRDSMPPCALEQAGPQLFDSNSSQREYDVVLETRNGQHFATESNPDLSSRVAGSVGPTRSMGRIGGDWQAGFGKNAPLRRPEIFTWGFSTPPAPGCSRWLMLCCDGLYNHSAFRGPKSACDFLMDPFHYLAHHLQKNGNMWWMQVMRKRARVAGLPEAIVALLDCTRQMREAEIHLEDAPAEHAIEHKRPLLRDLFKHIYRIERLCPSLFYGDNAGADAIHQAIIFLMQWVAFGQIGGLRGPEEHMNPLDLAAALAYVCSMLHCDDNVSISLVKLSF